MVKLIELSACDGLLPLTLGGITLSESKAASIFSIAPYRGKQDEVGKLLESALGLGFPTPDRFETGKDDAQILWAGRGRALLIGAAVPTGIGAIAAVTDQSDGSAAVRIEGAEVEEVLARLVPLDLRLRHFPVGSNARTLIGHMTAQVLRVAEEGFVLITFRSMARSLVHELERAARGYLARG